MSQRGLLTLGFAANAGVAAISYLVYGWNAIGAHVAARSTARVSALFFVVAFAQPSLARFIASLTSYAATVRTFVAAHCAHFLTVVIVLALDKAHQLRQSPSTTAAIVLIGFTLVMLAGVTAGRRSITTRAIHAVSVYAVFTIFTLAFIRHRVWPVRGIAVLLIIALLLRLNSIVIAKREIARSASA